MRICMCQIWHAVHGGIEEFDYAQMTTSTKLKSTLIIAFAIHLFGNSVYKN